MRQKNKGFTLLGAIVSLALLGIIVLSILQIFYMNFFVMRKSVDKITAATVAYNVLERYINLNDFDDLAGVPATAYIAAYNTNNTQINNTEYIYDIETVYADSDTKRVNVTVRWWVGDSTLPANLKTLKLSTVKHR